MKRLLCAVLALAACTHASLAADSPAPLPLEYFFAPPSFRLPRLAPDGRSYSVVMLVGQEEVLSLVDFATNKATPLLRTDARFRNYWWKSPDLLLILDERDGRAGFETFNLKTLKTDQPSDLRYAGLANPLPDDPENVLLVRYRNWDLDLLKFNVRTGRATQVPVPSGYVQRWLTTSRGDVVAGFGRLHEKWFMVLPQGSGWRRVELGDRRLPDFQPVWVAEDQRRLVGFDSASGDTVRLIAWDPATDAKELLCAADTIDPEYLSAWGEDWTRMQYVAFETDRPKFRYLNADDQAVADALDAALPNTTNQIVSVTPDKSRLIVFSTSDRVAGDFYLFDVKVRKLVKFGTVSPKPQPARLAQSRYFDFSSRDGLTLHGRVHLPPNSKGPWPTVVIVDGPERSHFGYSPREQALACAGYAVVDIDTRGTVGYGERFWAAGNQELGGKIVDDLVDGIDWLAQKQIVDPARVAVLGYLQGGLTVVQAARRHPQRFAAVVNFWAPAHFDYVDHMDFVYGRMSQDEVKSRLGGETGVRRYMETLNPVPILSELKVPSFHYYPRDPKAGLYYEAERVQRALAKSGAPHVFLEGLTIRGPDQLLGDHSPDFPREWRRVFGELLPFLDRHVAKKTSP